MFLLGEYEVSIDDKGRLRLPSDLLRQLGMGKEEEEGMNLVMHVGMEQCIWMWREDTFRQLLTRLSKLNFFNSKQRHFNRFFNRGMTQISTDKAERILLRERLLDFAGLEKSGTAVLLCQQQRIEIWSPKIYYALFEDTKSEEFSEISDMVLGGGTDSGAESEEFNFDNIFDNLSTGNSKTTENE